MSKIKEQARPTSNRWDSSYGTYLTGQAAIDGADAVAIDLEQYWGAGRLRLLVDVELREKFDRQRFKLQTAIQNGKLQEVITEARRMTVAWWALDRAAKAAGALPLAPVVWETALADGTVVALVRSREEAHAVVTSGRKVVVYDLEEIARMLQNYHEVTAVKVTFPGATVTQIRQSIGDPLDGIRDGVRREDTLDDPLPDLG
jgi:hypothetical protein